MNRNLVGTVVALSLTVAAAGPAFAGVGLRTGLSLDPDDFLIGFHFRSNPLQESLFLVPSFEAGFGDITMLAGNLDLHYRFKTQSELKPYAGSRRGFSWRGRLVLEMSLTGSSWSAGTQNRPTFRFARSIRQSSSD
jgi:hypothetical protein